MKVLIFGGHGRTGRYVVAQAGKHQLTIYENDILDAASVDKAMQGMDAVVCVVGHVKGSNPRMQTRGIQNIIESMKKHRVKRIISLTGTGVRALGDNITLMDRLMNLAVKLVDPERVRDGEAHAKELQSSGLDYTIIRVLKLTGGNTNGKWNLNEHGPAKAFVPRKVVAEAIIQVLNEKSYIKQMPIISARRKGRH